MVLNSDSGWGNSQSRNTSRFPGSFQSSLRDFSSLESLPRTASWAKFSRPCGTDFAVDGSHADSLAPEVRFYIWLQLELVESFISRASAPLRMLNNFIARPGLLSILRRVDCESIATSSMATIRSP